MDPTAPNSSSTVGPAVVVDPARPSSPATPAPKVPEFLASKLSQQDFETLPESARNILVERAKDVQEDYRQKTTSLANDRKSVEGLMSIQKQLDDDPKLGDHIAKSIKDYKSGKPSGTAPTSDDWEQLKSDADPDGLKILTAIEKRFNSKSILDKLEVLGQQLGQVVSGNQVSRRAQLDQEFAQLPKEFQALATENKDALIRLGISMPQKSARDLLGIHLFNSGSRVAYEDAVAAERNRSSTEKVEQAKTLGGFPSNAGAPETPAATEADWTQSRDPRFGPQLKIGNVIQRAFDEVKRHMPGA